MAENLDYDQITEIQSEGKEELDLNLNGLIHFPLSEAEVIPRPYGIMYNLSATPAHIRNMQVLLMQINPGYMTSRHYHPNEEVMYVLEGEVLVYGKAKAFTIKAGDALIVRPGEVHYLENKSSNHACRILLSISPPRDPEKVVYVE